MTNIPPCVSSCFMKDDKENYSSWLKTYGHLGYLSILFPALIVIGYFAGKWLDDKVNSKPLFVVVFILLGFASAIRTMIKEVTRADQDENKK